MNSRLPREKLQCAQRLLTEFKRSTMQRRSSHGVFSKSHKSYRPKHKSIVSRDLSLRVESGNMGRFRDEEEYPAELPLRFEMEQKPYKSKPLVKVRLSVNYRVHSRQMLCIGGSQIPFGWSFLSIAKVPMTWNSGDIWTCEVEFAAGQRVEYKYVILEEQDWTKQENEDAEGLVDITYRSESEPGRPPDVQAIQKQMAIVAWQPGPNRVLLVPSEAELQQLRPGVPVERTPARPGQRMLFESEKRLIQSKQPPPPTEREVLSLSEDRTPVLERFDAWGWNPGPSSRPASMSGISL